MENHQHRIWKNKLLQKIPKFTKCRIIWLQDTPHCARHWVIQGKIEKMEVDLTDEENMEVDEEVVIKEEIEVDEEVDEEMKVDG